MKTGFLLLALLCLAPRTARAAEECPGCVMGIYDTPAMQQNHGRFDDDTKEVYLGVTFDPAVATGLRGVEFSIDGLSDFFVTFEPDPGANIVIGETIQTPMDEQDSTGGGLNVAWPICQDPFNGRFVFGTITMISLEGPGSVGEDLVLRVRRKFPSTNINEQFALFSKCNHPIYTAISPEVGCYIINPSQPPGSVVDGCTSETAVDASSWTAVKSLYRE